MVRIHYEVQIASNSNFTDLILDENDLSELQLQNYTELTDGKYYWRVRAWNSLGEPGRWSKSWYFLIDTVPPVTPILLKPFNYSRTVDTTPYLLAKSVSGAKYYHFQICTPDQKNADWSNCDVDYDRASVGYTIPKTLMLSYGSYYWRVRARDVAGNWSNWSSEHRLDITQDPMPFNGPILIEPLNKSTINNSPQLKWQEITGAEQYEIEISKNRSFSKLIERSVIDATLTSYTSSELLDGVYYWRIRALEAVRGAGDWNIPNSFKIDTTPPIAVHLKPSANTYIRGTLTLRAKTSRDIVSYQFEVAQLVDDNLVTVAQSQESNISSYIPPLANYGVYYWRILVKDSAGNCRRSSYRMVTVLPKIPAKSKLIEPCTPRTH